MSKFMRLLVFFDLPVKAKYDRKKATQFRQYLIKDGFYMIQFSVYGRLCATIENAYSHEARLIAQLPQKGSVRTLIVTEKQYAEMHILVGKKKTREAHTKSQQLSFF